MRAVKDRRMPRTAPKKRLRGSLPATQLSLAGHIDFYGWDSHTEGWFVSGWSSAQATEQNKTKIAAHFQNGAIVNQEHVAGFYRRDDLPEQGVGFLVFLKDATSSRPGLAFLEFNFDRTAARISAKPTTPLLSGAELRSRLAGLVGDLFLPDRYDPGCPFFIAKRLHEIEYLRTFNLIDERYYIAHSQHFFEKTPDDLLEHFYDIGYQNGVGPNQYFDCGWYLQTHPDVAARRMNPLYHYAKWGEAEGRRPSVLFDPIFYREKYRLHDDMCALSHYLEHRKNGRYSPIAEFDVDFYLRDGHSIGVGGIDPFEHYLLQGYKEGRKPSRTFVAGGRRHQASGENPLVQYLMAQQQRRPIPVGQGQPLAPCRPAGGGVALDTVFVSPTGRCFISGWLEPAEAAPVREIGLYREGALVGWTANAACCRRPEAEARFPASGPNLPGFWAVVSLDRPVDAGTGLQISIAAADREHRCTAGVASVTDVRLRHIALEHLANAQYYGEPTIEAFFQLDNGVAQSLIDLNTDIVTRTVSGSYRMRFGARRGSYDATIIVCLYGKPEFLTLQAALFSQCPGYDRYEFIYVLNSPELCQILAKDAAIASRTYGVAITLIILPDNAGFGAANNVAAAAAETDRLIFVNPDVLPRDPQWPQRHAAMVEDLPAEQVRLFGASLYYDDGSLMHGGMYIDLDGGFSTRGGTMMRRDVLRVEHYGKGLPADFVPYLASRPVPAVTGAFISLERGWFERLGGFSPNYIFGHYEDVDLCLRSLEAGTPAWVHDLPFWHLESRGSTQERAHIGGRLVNRWLMTSTWGELVTRELNGRNPARFAEPARASSAPISETVIPLIAQRRAGAR
jgi:GT2 family glycosyltransferase